MLNFDISELVNIDASHMPNPLRTSILPCKAMAYSHKSLTVINYLYPTSGKCWLHFVAPASKCHLPIILKLMTLVSGQTRLWINCYIIMLNTLRRVKTRPYPRFNLWWWTLSMPSLGFQVFNCILVTRHIWFHQWYWLTFQTSFDLLHLLPRMLFLKFRHMLWKHNIICFKQESSKNIMLIQTVETNLFTKLRIR